MIKNCFVGFLFLLPFVFVEGSDINNAKNVAEEKNVIDKKKYVNSFNINGCKIDRIDENGKINKLLDVNVDYGINTNFSIDISKDEKISFDDSPFDLEQTDFCAKLNASFLNGKIKFKHDFHFPLRLFNGSGYIGKTFWYGSSNNKEDYSFFNYINGVVFAPLFYDEWKFVVCEKINFGLEKFRYYENGDGSNMIFGIWLSDFIKFFTNSKNDNLKFLRLFYQPSFVNKKTFLSRYYTDDSMMENYKSVFSSTKLGLEVFDLKFILKNNILRFGLVVRLPETHEEFMENLKEKEYYRVVFSFNVDFNYKYVFGNSNFMYSHLDLNTYKAVNKVHVFDDLTEDYFNDKKTLMAVDQYFRRCRRMQPLKLQDFDEKGNLKINDEEIVQMVENNNNNNLNNPNNPNDHYIISEEEKLKTYKSSLEEKTGFRFDEDSGFNQAPYSNIVFNEGNYRTFDLDKFKNNINLKFEIGYNKVVNLFNNISIEKPKIKFSYLSYCSLEKKYILEYILASSVFNLSLCVPVSLNTIKWISCTIEFKIIDNGTFGYQGEERVLTKNAISAKYYEEKSWKDLMPSLRKLSFNIEINWMKLFSNK